ncbi:hypothetical protein M413DRAFT_448229 [Hebeloma cylindrosporum]|uniref:Major facilitator superfamily (MFS) profile domain-containing protein n=1 Tax=Hebeloma cylindrosporum TaxID=76867 RepID=A0A0C2XIR7_HEBCY|nr:hypothetical protein M413DRAFT_448229 [Hebeloma cylindrosporum h7]
MSETNEGRSKVETSRSEAVSEVPTPTTKTEPSLSNENTLTKDEKSSIKDVVEDIKPEDEDIIYPTGLVLAAVVLALCLAVFLVALDQTIIATAIPRITDKFHSVKDIGWYGAAYFLTSTSLQPSFGRFYKTFSVKGTFLSAIFIFEIGSLICALAPTSIALIVGRAIAGIGVGGLFSGALVIMAHSMPLQKRPIVFGLIGGMFGLASVAGPLLGGVFTDHVSWRWCFYINLPVGAFSIVVIAFVLKIPQKANPKNLSIKERISDLDLIGASILIPAIISLILALQWGGSTYPWNNSRIIGLFVCSGCLILLFVYSQIKLGERATLPIRILSQRTVAATSLFSGLFGGGFFVLIFYLPLYFQSIKGVSATKSGIEILPLILSNVVASIVAGGLITVTGYYTPFINLGSIMLAIGSGLISTLDVDSPFSKWFGYQLLTGIGSGMSIQVSLLAVQAVLDIDDVPIGTACIIFFQTLGGALFVAVAQTVFQNGVVRAARELVPDIDPALVLNAGATQLRAVLTTIGKQDELAAVLRVYMVGLRDAFRVSVGLASAAVLAAVFVEWKSIKSEQVKRNRELTGGMVA